MLNTNDETYVLSSIHCSYYAVLQCMKYSLTIAKQDPMNYSEQENKSKNQRVGTHEFVINEIANRIMSVRERFKFTSEVRDLKQKRVDSDYSTTKFTIESGLEIKQQADHLISQLKRFFPS